jgi:hypothetical protein
MAGCPVSPKQMREKEGLMARQSSFIAAKLKAGALCDALFVVHLNWPHWKDLIDLEHEADRRGHGSKKVTVSRILHYDF